MALPLAELAEVSAGQGDERPPGEPGTGAEPVAIVLEPTGGYELAFALWARSQGGRAKTDQQDALLLAHFGPAPIPRCPSGSRWPLR
jgi:transposase